MTLRLLRLVPLLLALAAPAAGPRAMPAAPSCPVVPVPPVALPGLSAAVAAGRPVTIVALGSSSTSGAGSSSPGATYPAQLQDWLRAILPRAQLRVVNRGVGGETVVEMLERLDRDVLAEAPTLVVWQLGGNSVLRGLDPEMFGRLVAQGLERLRAAGAEVVLMDNQRAPFLDARPGHAAYARALAELADDAPGVELFSRGRLMDAWAAAGTPPSAMLVGDGLHHNDRGYACVAEALAEAILAGMHEGQ